MTLEIATTSILSANSYEEVKSTQSNIIWQQLEKVLIEEAAKLWLGTLSPKTRINYQSGLRRLAELKLLAPSMSLQAFALVNHESRLGPNAVDNRGRLAIFPSPGF
jgi:hypothetical protein